LKIIYLYKKHMDLKLFNFFVEQKLMYPHLIKKNLF